MKVTLKAFCRNQNEYNWQQTSETIQHYIIINKIMVTYVLFMFDINSIKVYNYKNCGLNLNISINFVVKSNQHIRKYKFEHWILINTEHQMAESKQFVKKLCL